MKFIQTKHSIAGYLAIIPILVGCGSLEGSDPALDLVDTEVNQSALLTPTPEPTEDTLAAYAAKCEIATGIRIPDFSCSSGLSGAADPNGASEANFAFVSQASSVDNILNVDQFGVTGTRTYVNGDQTKQQIQVTGGAIDGVSDAFYFGRLFMDFYGTSEVKITSLTSPGATAMAGLMFRQYDDFEANASNVLLAVAPSPGCSGQGCAKIVFQRRVAKSNDTTDLASVTTLAGSTVTLPLWLKLTWNGSGVVAQASKDHNGWTQIGSTLDDEASPYRSVGLAVASTTANFEGFKTSKKCDKPNVLSGNCEPDSTFQVLARTSDAIAVANCRKGAQTGNDEFADIAVIQYNRTNGAICFYQSPTGNANNGKTISSPAKGNGAGLFDWDTPEETHNAGCTGCHDSGGLIRSPYLNQTGLLPQDGEGYNNDGLNMLRYVGLAFDEDRSWTVNLWTNDNCTGCHTLAMNNVDTNGTAYSFAVMANSRYQTKFGHETGSEADGSRKNDVSVTSPTWMPYGNEQTSWIYDEGSNFSPYLAAAREYQACARLAWGEDLSNEAPNPSQAEGFVSPLLVGGCDFFPHGQPYYPSIDNLNEYEIKTGADSTGSATGNLAAVSITAAAKTDVYDPADNFYWLYKNQGGDGSAVVRVKSLTGGNEFAKAGIMFRNGYSTTAVNVMLALTKGHGATFQYRATSGGTTSTAYLDANTSINPESTPTWLRLDRTGRTFVGYISTNDRETWTQVAPPITLPGLETDFVGLVATSNKDSTATATAQFESFDWGDRTGWTGLYNAHVFVDSKIATTPTTMASISSKRKEWITRDTISVTSGDITGTADNFSYSYKTSGGPGHLETTVTSLSATNGGTLNEWTKAGLMVRENANANAMNVFVGRTRDGVTFQARQATAGTTTANNIPLTLGSNPVSFRLRRDNVGSQTVFSAAYMIGSGDWIAWPQTFTFAAFHNSPLAGLAVSSNNGPDATAVFTSGATFEPPGMLWTSYEQWSNNTWLDADVASPMASRFVNGVSTKTLTSAGAGITGTSDQFEYAFQNLPGAATIQAKVTLQGDPSTNPLAKAGIMFRAKAGPTSRNVMIALTKAYGATFQYRPSDGAGTSASNYTGSGSSMWLKLVRTASNQFMGYTSLDGVSWTLLSSTTLSNISSIAMVGFAVTSNDVTHPVTATFSDISVTLQGSTQGPCASFCTSPTTFTFGNNYQSGSLGTGARCMQTTRPVLGGNCGNFVNGRTLRINGVSELCNNQNFTPPAPVNGGYCVQITPGNQSFAYFTLFN